jgi:hypothetical protein
MEAIGDDLSAALAAADAAAVGVLAYVQKSGRPHAVAITPYVVDGCVVVTSTLAYIDKAVALRRDPRMVITAGGWSMEGSATVGVDTTPAWFDRHLREQELRKYPPARSITGIPGHRRLFGWYVGRMVMALGPALLDHRQIGDTATVTVLDRDGRLQTICVPRPASIEGDAMEGNEIVVGPELPDGDAVLLVHEEDETMADLRQLWLRGTLQHGRLTVERHRGSLTPTASGVRSQLATARRLARAARANRAELSTWPPPWPPLA